MTRKSVSITKIQLYEPEPRLWVFCIEAKGEKWPYDDAFKADNLEKAKEILLKKMIFHYNNYFHYFRAESIDRLNCIKIIKDYSHKGHFKNDK